MREGDWRKMKRRNSKWRNESKGRCVPSSICSFPFLSFSYLIRREREREREREKLAEQSDLVMGLWCGVVSCATATAPYLQFCSVLEL